jgi:nucleoside-diphosphate-sugar epimerase
VKKILITGGAGFIGSHLAARYTSLGIPVLVVDNLSTGTLDNLAGIDPALLEVAITDIRDEQQIAKLVRGCDLVVHLAARVGLKVVVEQPLETLETNVEGTASVLRAACASKTKVIVASTSEVYGLATRIPSSEDDPITIGAPTRNRWSYAASKALDEFLAFAYWRERMLPIVIVRLFNTVGPRQSGRYGMVIPSFIRMAMANEPLTVYGNGTQTRCFCHVRDVAGALVALGDDPRAVGEVFNLGNPEETTINDLAARVIALTGSSSKITYMSHDLAYGEAFQEIQRRVPDISKIQEAIGFMPSARLDEILTEIIAGMRVAVA